MGKHLPAPHKGYFGRIKRKNSQYVDTSYRAEIGAELGEAIPRDLLEDLRVAFHVAKHGLWARNEVVSDVVNFAMLEDDNHSALEKQLSHSLPLCPPCHWRNQTRFYVRGLQNDTLHERLIAGAGKAATTLSKFMPPHHSTKTPTFSIYYISVFDRTLVC